MLSKLLLLHLRWLGLFVFVAMLMTVFSQLQNRDAGKLADIEFWRGLVPMFAVCVALAVVVPWAVFMVDPRRTDRLNVATLLNYWRTKR